MSVGDKLERAREILQGVKDGLETSALEHDLRMPEGWDVALDAQTMCGTCGAVVARNGIDLHLAWHSEDGKS